MRIAVIGSGISGLSAAYLLSQKHEVHLFESGKRWGGHAHTVDVREGDRSLPMDTGFLVYNRVTYPHLCGFFDHLGVETCDSDMSLSIQNHLKNLEWSGTNINTVFGQRRNLFRPSFYKMISGILRFHKEAQQNLAESISQKWSLEQLLKQKKYSQEFATDYILPIGAAIWSTPERKMLDYPAETFLQFFINHKLLQVNDRPVWRTVRGGSRQYVNKVISRLSHCHLDSAVNEVAFDGDSIRLVTRGEILKFDKVVMACHAPQTRKILKNPDPKMLEVLSAFETQENRAFLHRDLRFMPRRKKLWSAWNVQSRLSGTGSQTEKVSLPPQNKVTLTYYLNKLQPLDTRQDYFVTLNSDRPVEAEIDISYAHPIFDRAAIEAQRKIPSIQGLNGVYLAGAWTRYGFHEDGILSAVRVGRALGIEPPWTPQYLGDYYEE